jgi:hypothetical protein
MTWRVPWDRLAAFNRGRGRGQGGRGQVGQVFVDAVDVRPVTLQGVGDARAWKVP